MKKVRVAISDKSFDAYDNGCWNGFVRPLFTREVGLAMCESDDFKGMLKYEESEDRFVFDDGIAYEAYDAIDMDGFHLYPIGAGSMAWVATDHK
jgi:hypothetical protein